MKVIVIVPAFNEEKTIRSVIDDVSNYCDQVIVIDDGSSDRTHEIATQAGATVYHHAINRGLGAALGTGMEAAILHDADAIITFDADGQHQGKDIPRLTQALHQGDVVIGSRLLDPKGMPIIRRTANFIGNVVTGTLFGIWVNDSQSGLRCFDRLACEKIEIKGGSPPGMEASSEIIQEIKRHKLKLVEIPIKSIYTSYSMSKGQSFAVGLKTLSRLLLRKVIK